MSVGIPVDKATIDRSVGNVILALHAQFDRVATIQAYLAGKTTQDLVDMGYTQADVTLIKSAFTDLTKLMAIAHGQDVQASESNFFFFADQLTGLQ